MPSSSLVPRQFGLRACSVIRFIRVVIVLMLKQSESEVPLDIYGTTCTALHCTNMPTVRDRNVKKLRRMKKRAKARLQSKLKETAEGKNLG